MSLTGYACKYQNDAGMAIEMLLSFGSLDLRRDRKSR